MAGGANELDQVLQDNLLPLVRAENYNSEDVANDIVVKYGINESGALVYEADFGSGFIPWGTTTYLTYSRSLTGVSDTSFYVIGTDDVIASGQTGNYTTSFSVGNQHVSFLINSLTGTGTITLTGTSTSEETNVPVADTEILTVDAIGNYQTSKKWMEITDITVAGFTAINYDVGNLGYMDLSNNDFRLMGYRCDARSQSNTADFKFEIFHIKDLGDGKFERMPLESIGIDSTNGNGSQVDNLRTGGANRSFTFGQTAFPNDTDYVFKQGDFFPFFGDDAHILGSLPKNEGMQIKLSGQGDADITGTDSIVIGLAIIKTS